MTDKTDPRLDAIGRWIAESERFPAEWRGGITEMLAVGDAADRATKVVRVDMKDEALVSSVASDVSVVAMGQQMGKGALPEPIARRRREALVRAVLAALREES